MAEDNEKLRKQVGDDGKSMPIKGSVTKTDLGGEKDTTTQPRIKPMRLPPKHQFKG